MARIHELAKSNQLDVLKTLLQNEPIALQATDEQGMTALHWALWNGHWDCAWFLLSQSGADAMAIDDHQRSILYFAVDHARDAEFIAQLLSKITRFQCNQLLLMTDSQGNSVLHVAANHGCVAVIDYLIEQNVDVNARNHADYTPLHHAVKHGHLDATQHLIETGADPYLINANGDNAIHHARRFGQVELVMALQGWLLDSWAEALQMQVDDPEELPGIIDELKQAHARFNECFSHDAFQQYCTQHIDTNLEQDLKKSFEQRCMYDFLQLVTPLIEQTEFRFPLLTCHILLERSDRYCLSHNYKDAIAYAIAAKVYYQKQVNPKNECFLQRLTAQIQRIIILFRQEVCANFDPLPELQTTLYRHQLDNHRRQMRQRIATSETTPTLLKDNTQFFIELTANIFSEAQRLFNQTPPPKGDYTLIGLGSMGRGEMSLYSDLEFAIIIKQDTPQIRDYFTTVVKLMELLVISLGETPFSCLSQGYGPTAIGFRFDDGGNVPLPRFDGDRMCEQPSRFLGTITALVNIQKEPSNLYIIARNALRTTCFIHGSQRLFQAYEKALWKTLTKTDLTNRWWFQSQCWLNHHEALELMRGDLNEFSPDQLAAQKYDGDVYSFNVKRELYRLPSQTIANLCLYYGIKTKNTWARLGALRNRSILSPQGFANLTQLMDIVTRLRLKMHDYYEEERESLHHASLMEPPQDRRDKSLYSLNRQDLDQLISLYRVLITVQQALSEFIDAADNYAKVSNNPFSTSNLHDNQALTEITALDRLGLPVVVRQRYQQLLLAHPDQLNYHVQYLDFEEMQWQALQKYLNEGEQSARTWIQMLVTTLRQRQEPEANYLTYFESLPAWHSLFCAEVRLQVQPAYGERILDFLARCELDRQAERLGYFRTQIRADNQLQAWHQSITQENKLEALVESYKNQLPDLPPRYRTEMLVIALDRLNHLQQQRQRSQQQQQAIITHALDRCVLQLTTQTRRQADYIQIYQQLPLRLRQGFRQALIRLIDADDTQDFLHPVLLALNNYPDEAGNRGRWEETKQQWRECMANLVQGQVEEHVDFEHQVSLTSALFSQTACPQGYGCQAQQQGQVCSFSEGTFALVPEIQSALLDQHRFKATTIEGSRHQVVQVDLSQTSSPISGIHVKANPEMPGMSYLIERLHHYLIGHGTTLSELVKLNLPNQANQPSLPLQISKTIAGPTLGQVLKDDPEILNTLNHRLYTELVLVALLTNPEDGIPSNFIVTEVPEAEGGGITLVSIDHDHALFPAFLDIQGENEPYPTPKLQIKTILFCLEQMHQAIDSQAREHFLQLDPQKVLRQVLRDAQNQNQHYERMFTAAQIRDFHRKAEAVEACTIPIPIKSGDIAKLYHKIVRLQYFIRHKLDASLLDCLLHLEPRAGLVYQRALSEPISPQARLQRVGEYPVSAQGKLQSYTQARSVLLMSTLLNQTAYQNLKNLKPEEGLAELDRMSYQQDRLGEIRDQVQQGELGEFKALIAPHHKEWILNGFSINQHLESEAAAGQPSDEANETVETAITACTIQFPGIDLAQMTTTQQTALLTALLGTPLTRLLLPNCSGLTPELFQGLISSCPDLVELDLSAHPDLTTNHLLLLAEVCGRSLQKLTLKHLSQLQRLEGKFPELTTLMLNDSQVEHINIAAPKLTLLEARRCRQLQSIQTHSEQPLSVDLHGISWEDGKLDNCFQDEALWDRVLLERQFRV